MCMWHCLSTLTKQTWAQQKKKNTEGQARGGASLLQGVTGWPHRGKSPRPSRVYCCPGHPSARLPRPMVTCSSNPQDLLAGTQPVPSNQAKCAQRNKRPPAQPRLCTPAAGQGADLWTPPTPGDQGNPDGAAGKTQVRPRGRRGAQPGMSGWGSVPARRPRPVPRRHTAVPPPGRASSWGGRQAG